MSTQPNTNPATHVKPAINTTEFWLTAATVIVPLALDIINARVGEGSLLAAIIAGLYAALRTYHKTRVMKDATDSELTARVQAILDGEGVDELYVSRGESGDDNELHRPTPTPAIPKPVAPG